MFQSKSSYLIEYSSKIVFFRKKEKVLHCNIITDAISNPTIKVSANFPLLLSNAIEVLLKLCDDQESDIRMTSEECLNRIIRVNASVN